MTFKGNDSIVNFDDRQGVMQELLTNKKNDLIDTIKNKLELNYNSEWFASGYYVYVIKIEVGKDIFYYVGQTGDRHFIAARSPFYRLWGHFNPYNLKKGTDSQLMSNLFKRKIFCRKDGESNRLTIDRALAKKDAIISAQFYPIEDFVNDNTQISKDSHKQKRVFVEEIEKGVIEGLGYQVVFNDVNKKGFQKIMVSPKARKISNQILQDLEPKRLNAKIKLK